MTSHRMGASLNQIAKIGLVFAFNALKHKTIVAILAGRRQTAMGKSDVISEPSVSFARNVDWNLFKVFHEIARRGGIGAAARALNRKQPSITAALRRLEDQVGTTLCTRTPRGIELTIHGHQLLAACESLQASVRNIPRAISATSAEHFRHGDAPRIVEFVQSQHAVRHF